MKKNNFNLILEMAGMKYYTRGETIHEAMLKLPLDWHNIKGKGIFNIKQGKKSVEHLFYQKQLRRIFANKLTMILWSRRLNLLLR